MMRHLTKEEEELMELYDKPETTDDEKAKIIERLKEIDEAEDIFN